MCKWRINIPRRSLVWVLYHSGLRFDQSKGVALSLHCVSYKIDRLTHVDVLSQSSGAKLFSYANAFFCSNKFA